MYIPEAIGLRPADRSVATAATRERAGVVVEAAVARAVRASVGVLGTDHAGGRESSGARDSPRRVRRDRRGAVVDAHLNQLEVHHHTALGVRRLAAFGEGRRDPRAALLTFAHLVDQLT